MIFGYPYHQIIEFSVQPILTLCSSTARHLHIGDPEGYWDKMKSCWNNLIKPTIYLSISRLTKSSSIAGSHFFGIPTWPTAICGNRDSHPTDLLDVVLIQNIQLLKIETRSSCKIRAKPWGMGMQCTLMPKELHIVCVYIERERETPLRNVIYIYNIVIYICTSLFIDVHIHTYVSTT